jgi:hypothetical protein
MAKDASSGILSQQSSISQGRYTSLTIANRSNLMGFRFANLHEKWHKSGKHPFPRPAILCHPFVTCSKMRNPDFILKILFRRSLSLGGWKAVTDEFDDRARMDHIGPQRSQERTAQFSRPVFYFLCSMIFSCEVIQVHQILWRSEYQISQQMLGRCDRPCIGNMIFSRFHSVQQA